MQHTECCIPVSVLNTAYLMVCCMLHFEKSIVYLIIFLAWRNNQSQGRNPIGKALVSVIYMVKEAAMDIIHEESQRKICRLHFYLPRPYKSIETLSDRYQEFIIEEYCLINKINGIKTNQCRIAIAIIVSWLYYELWKEINKIHKMYSFLIPHPEGIFETPVGLDPDFRSHRTRALGLTRDPPESQFLSVNTDDVD